MTKITSPLEAVPEAPSIVSQIPDNSRKDAFSTVLAEMTPTLNETAQIKQPNESPYHFIQSTWLTLLYKYGEADGVKSELLQKIHLNAAGHPKVADRPALATLKALRQDPVLAAKMAAHYLEEGRLQLKNNLHREPAEAEIHMAYLLGPTGATTLIQVAEHAPSTPVDQVIGAAAAGNKSLFFDRDGNPISAAEAVAYFKVRYELDKSRFAAYEAAPATTPKIRIHV